MSLHGVARRCSVPGCGRPRHRGDLCHVHLPTPQSVAVRSILTGRVNVRDLPVTLEQLHRIEAGEPVQVVAPHLSADDREFLVNGVTPEEAAALLPAEGNE